MLNGELEAAFNSPFIAPSSSFTVRGIMSEGILLFIEQRDGVLNRTSYEALVAAQGIGAATGDKISAVAFGRGISGIATDVAGKKLEAVYTVEDDKLAEYTPGGYVAALKQVIEQLSPRLIIFSHT